MHMGFIIYGDINTLTGGYIYDKYLIRRLRQSGHTVEIISLPKRFYPLNITDNYLNQRVIDLLKMPFDLLLQDALTHPSLFWINRKLKNVSNFPIVTIVHQVLCLQPRRRPQNQFYRMIEKRYFESVDGYIFNSKTSQAAVESKIGKNRPAIVAVPGGDRLGRLHPKEKIKTRSYRSGPLRLIFIGNVMPHKGLYRLIEVLARISPKKWHLTVVGSLSMNKKYVMSIKKFVARKNLFRHIVFTGPLNGTELAKRLDESQIFAMPFSHEGFGIVYAESMAFGLPAIGSTAGAAREMIEHGCNGFLVAPNNSEALIKKIEVLYHDRTQLVKMSTAALETFDGMPKWSESLSAIQIFLEKLVP